MIFLRLQFAYLPSSGALWQVTVVPVDSGTGRQWYR